MRLIRLGDSAEEVTRKLSPPWEPVGTNRFIGKGFFSQWVPWTNAAVVLEWQSERQGDEWPSIIFALFSDVRKTNLVDAVVYRSGTIGLVDPVLDGPYNRRVLAIKPGDNMETVFKELGQRDCEYFKGDDGKWRVRSFYYTCEGHIIVYEADAGTGVILQARDETI
jgi:hypothetical protein